MSSRIPMLVLASAILAVPSLAAAQFRDDVPRDGACFYEDADFRGSYFCVQAGDELTSLPQGNDRVSSIRVYGRAEVVVFRDRGFRGDSRRFTDHARNLIDDGFNDAISSIEVRDARLGGRGRGRGIGSGIGRGQNPDAIVRRAYQDVLNREPDSDGMRTYRSRIIDDGWTEQQVRDALRNSPEYREQRTMNPARAQQIVRQAYLNVLNREPDPAASPYVNRVLREGWTQQDVERELRRSPEYRERGR
jgi:hypothetical protein